MPTQPPCSASTMPAASRCSPASAQTTPPSHPASISPVRNTHIFCSPRHFMKGKKLIILPRQAWDNHRESTQFTKNAFSAGFGTLQPFMGAYGFHGGSAAFYWCEKRPVFPQLFLCLSRACLGKTIGYMLYQLLKRGGFRRDQSLLSSLNSLLGAQNASISLLSNA